MERIAKRVLGAVALAATLGGTASAQTTIDFDGLANGDIVTNQFAGVGALFSSTAGASNIITAQNLGTSLPNFICTGFTSISCVLPTYVDFTTAVGGLSFFGVGINNVGTVAQARVYSGQSLIGTVNVQGAGTALVPVLVDFGATSGITRLEIDNITDAAGIGWDDFTFTPGVSAVPEPSTYLLVGSGLLAIAGLARRRRA